MFFPSSRAAALAQLNEFIPLAGIYVRDRNHEQEVVAAVLRVHPFGQVEKFIQEVYWRRYWKSWLSQRPYVWDEYRDRLTGMGDSLAVRSIEKMQSGNVVIDHFVH